ncbi:hypothetical protein EJ06DRAFT_390931 [Trichodelitschia bisporula]|uniref:Uncharacterized protein n=1 Tax=Trichodelitschia bisporula TaxID=703511 RepID=A0A6G1HZP0_9PEZI|nr:hypothetical protein EJ06DRAFT_390931 [Trichodelitschia bisporula]
MTEAACAAGTSAGKREGEAGLQASLACAFEFRDSTRLPRPTGSPIQEHFSETETCFQHPTSSTLELALGTSFHPLLSPSRCLAIVAFQRESSRRRELHPQSRSCTCPGQTLWGTTPTPGFWPWSAERRQRFASSRTEGNRQAPVVNFLWPSRVRHTRREPLDN